MASTTGPNAGIQHSWPLGEWYKDGMDANLQLLDAVLQLSVLSQSVSAPPGAPANGDRYIVGPAATGAWVGKEKQIAVYQVSAWAYYAPKTGWRAYDVAMAAHYTYDGVAWGLPSTPVAINLQVGAAYTLTMADRNNAVEMSNAGGNTVTVPLNADVAFPIGTSILIAQGGAGQTSIAAAVGVTIKKSETLKLRKQESVASLFKTAADTWRLFGDLEALP